MQLQVASETGRLRSVLVHLPGEEIDRMLPSMMSDLLFDDILFGSRAREEHRRFQHLIEFVADEVLEFRDLLTDVLRDEAARREILSDLDTRLRIPPRLFEGDSPEDMAGHLIEGILRPDVKRMPEDPRELYLLPPIPNLFFQRDPAVVIGDKVAIASMATEARIREPLLVSYIFSYHPRFGADATSPLLFHPFDADFAPSLSLAKPRPNFEGGDVLVASAEVLIVGISARTRRHTVEEFAQALKVARSNVKKLIVVDIPRARSFMHLDTVFTILSRDECLIYEPAVLPGEVEEVDVYTLEIGKKEVTYIAKESLLQALKGAGIDLKPIPCGGPDNPIAQQREQWTDGANAFALAPGIILCYDRNVRTAEELDRAGYEIVYDDDLLLGRTELNLTNRRKKYAIQITAHELARARGGPRCMTLPLARDPL